LIVETYVKPVTQEQNVKEYINRLNPVDIDDYRDFNYENVNLPNNNNFYMLHPEKYNNNYYNNNVLSKETIIKEDNFLPNKPIIQNTLYREDTLKFTNNQFYEKPSKPIDQETMSKASNLVDEFFKDVKNVKTEKVNNSVNEVIIWL